MSYKSGNAIITAKEDKLNRNNFKTAIAKSINNYSNNEMVAFGLNGAWGSGKSSIINLIKEEIDEDKYNILEFNPWYYSSRKQLLLDFFEQLSISVGCENTNSNTGAALEKYGKLMKAASLVPALSFLKIFGDISTEFGEFITKEESDSKENLHELKKTLMTEFKNMNKKILIIMDEIDRLEPNEIRELFQLVRALGDFDNIVYFLSYDFDVIKSAFADDKYTAKYTDKYIDKIINIQFDVPKSNKEDFNEYLKKEIALAYSGKIENSEDYPRIINEKNWKRLLDLLEGEKILFGGKSNPTDFYIEPTLVDEPKLNSKIMEDEIFGPILPILSYNSENDIEKIISRYEKPLAFYIFSGNKKFIKKQLITNSFGGSCVNDTIVHFTNHRLPFGGVGHSGIGSYHGKRSFDTFSHHKAVVKKATWLDIPIRYAPYKGKLKILKQIVKWLS